MSLQQIPQDEFSYENYVNDVFIVHFLSLLGKITHKKVTTPHTTELKKQ